MRLGYVYRLSWSRSRSTLKQTPSESNRATTLWRGRRHLGTLASRSCPTVSPVGRYCHRSASDTVHPSARTWGYRFCLRSPGMRYPPARHDTGLLKNHPPWTRTRNSIRGTGYRDAVYADGCDAHADHVNRPQGLWVGKLDQTRHSQSKRSAMLRLRFTRHPERLVPARLPNGVADSLQRGRCRIRTCNDRGPRMKVNCFGALTN